MGYYKLLIDNFITDVKQLFLTSEKVICVWDKQRISLRFFMQ